jgi:Domain of unknown function (DUF4279)
MNFGHRLAQCRAGYLARSRYIVRCNCSAPLARDEGIARVSGRCDRTFGRRPSGGNMFEPWCGEDDRCKASHALFSIRSDILSPAEVTATLGVSPTRAWAKDDPYQSRAGLRHRPWGMWHLSTKGVVSSRSPEQQALHLLYLLEPRAEAVRRYVATPEYLVTVSFWWESVTETAGFDLCSATVARLAALSNFISVTFIAHTNEEPAEPDAARDE